MLVIAALTDVSEASAAACPVAIVWVAKSATFKTSFIWKHVKNGWHNVCAFEPKLRMKKSGCCWFGYTSQTGTEISSARQGRFLEDIIDLVNNGSDCCLGWGQLSIASLWGNHNSCSRHISNIQHFVHLQEQSFLLFSRKSRRYFFCQVNQVTECCWNGCKMFQRVKC